jgi:hypothetical protein
MSVKCGLLQSYLCDLMSAFLVLVEWFSFVIHLFMYSICARHWYRTLEMETISVFMECSVFSGTLLGDHSAMPWIFGWSVAIPYC